ncbi:hypothetical protein HY771_01565 [Candidatus Uhrbacteria bacterium]|nr:hypothetical protein [Candidatus Uhrbacteria bacterium]
MIRNLCKFFSDAPASLARNSAAAESERRAKIPGGRPLSNPLPFCPPERSVWRAPARRSLGTGGEHAVISVQKRFGFRQTNAPFGNLFDMAAMV